MPVDVASGIERSRTLNLHPKEGLGGRASGPGLDKSVMFSGTPSRLVVLETPTTSGEVRREGEGEDRVVGGGGW